MRKDKTSRRPSRLVYFKNTTSMVGLVLAFSTGFFHVILLVLHLTAGFRNPYTGICFYVVLPPLVILGSALAILGAWRAHRLFKRTGEHTTLAKLSARRILLYGGPVILLLVVPFLGYSSYSGYRYADSNAFCGTACHTPMEPQFAAFQVSPHAEIGCTDCHVGEGVGSFVEAKIGGIRQLYRTLTDSYERPIPSPVHNLRPADDTCEHCHWSDLPQGEQLVHLPRVAADEKNTPRPINMVLKVGSRDPKTGSLTGIHWHTASTQKVEYVAADRQRLDIPWVRVTRLGEGEKSIKVFRSDGLDEDAPPPEGELRTMDCVDCHNRPAHRFRDADTILCRLFELGECDPGLPYLKREAGRALSASYTTKEEGLTAIRDHISGFYGESYPEMLEQKQPGIESAIKAVQQAFRENMFPEMKVDWRVHPDHRGHKVTPGCFRCHDDQHRAGDGSVISRDCSSCHDFLEPQGPTNSRVFKLGDYTHPYKLEKAHAEVDCVSCHDGGSTPSPDCQSCHADVKDFMAGRHALLPGFQGDLSPKWDLLGCTDCHEGAQRFAQDEIGATCVECHEEKYRDTEKQWTASLTEAKRKALEALSKGGVAKPSLKKLLESIDKIRPHHNVDFALDILERVRTGQLPAALDRKAGKEDGS